MEENEIIEFDPNRNRKGMPTGSAWTQCTDEQIKEALLQAKGVIVKAAKILDVERQTLQTKLTRNRDLREFQQQCKELRWDIAESKIDELVEEGNIRAIEIVLKQSDRGYNEKLDVNMRSVNLNLNVNVDLIKNLSEEELIIWNELHRKLLKSDDEN